MIFIIRKLIDSILMKIIPIKCWNWYQTKKLMHLRSVLAPKEIWCGNEECNCWVRPAFHKIQFHGED